MALAVAPQWEYASGVSTTPEPEEYGDAAFDAFAGASVTYGGAVHDAEGDRIRQRPRPMTWILVYSLALLGAFAILTPVPALIAAALAERAHRRGEPHMRFALAFCLVCTCIGTWAMLTIWR